MKINPSITLASLGGLAWGIAAWLAVTEITSTNMLVLAVGVGATLVLSAVARYCVSRVEKMIVTHADRMEKATSDHAQLLKEHVLALERFFKMGVRSDVLTKFDLAETRSMNGHDTGPLKVYDGGLSG